MLRSAIKLSWSIVSLQFCLLFYPRCSRQKTSSMLCLHACSFSSMHWFYMCNQSAALFYRTCNWESSLVARQTTTNNPSKSWLGGSGFGSVVCLVWSVICSSYSFNMLCNYMFAVLELRWLLPFWLKATALVAHHSQENFVIPPSLSCIVWECSI